MERLAAIVSIATDKGNVNKGKRAIRERWNGAIHDQGHLVLVVPKYDTIDHILISSGARLCGLGGVRCSRWPVG